MAKISFISLNIETNRHLDRVTNLIKKTSPDVICLQEVINIDLPVLATELGYDFEYAPMGHSFLVNGEMLGIAILSKGKLNQVKREHYVGNENSLPIQENAEVDEHNRCLLHGVYEKGGVKFHIGNTHFPKSPNGETDERQREVFKDFLPILMQYDDFMFSGDFNAPRGKEIFTWISEKFIDNIPQEYTTSIDKNLHRAGDLQLLVDGLFSTPQYHMTNVRLVDGVSDHLAILAEIEKSV